MPTSFSSSVIRGRPWLPRLRRDCSLTGARTTMSIRCQRLAGRLQKARSPRGLTFLTWHSRSIGKAPRCSSTNLNRTAFGSRRTGWLFSRISPFRRGNNPPDCFADPAQILKDADLAPKPLFSGQARGPLLRPHPCRDGRSPMGSRSTRRPPDHPQSDVAKARSSVQCAPHPCETHPSCLCPGFISFAAHCAIKGAPPSRDRSSFVRAELYTTPTYLTTSEVLRLVERGSSSAALHQPKSFCHGHSGADNIRPIQQTRIGEDAHEMKL